jgi:imidazolonepropionase-like amidohydrolase
VVSHAALLVWEGADSLPRRYNEGHPFNPFGPPAPFAAVPPGAPSVTRVLEAMRDRGVILDATVSTMRGAVSKQAYDWAVAVTAAAHRLGVPIAAGTDRDTFVDGYPALFAELEALVADVGLTPLEALTAATLTGARVLGREAELGSVEVGKVADLLVLERDPTAAIQNARGPLHVIKGGRVVTPLPR